MNRAELIKSMETKTTDLKTILAKGDAITFEDIETAKTLQGELADFKRKLEGFNALAELHTASSDADAFINEPAGHFRHAAPSSVNHLGNTDAGFTWMKRNKDGSVDVESIGKGLFGDKRYEQLNSNAYKDAFARYIMKGEKGLSSTQYKAIQDGIDDEGGFFAPPDYTLALIQRKPTPVNVNPKVFKWQTRSDAKIFPKIPYSGATDDPNAILYSTGVRVTYPGEVPATSTTVDTTEPGFGEFRVDVHTAMYAISLTRNMLDDSVISVMQFIQQKFQETDDLELDNRILNGTGVGQAAGILRNPKASATDPNEPQFVYTGAAAGLTYAGIKKLVYALAPQYITNANFIFNWQSTALNIDLLVDANNRPLWSEGVNDSGLSTPMMHRRLLGFMPIYSEFMPSIAAGNNVMVFGDLLGYYLVERLGLSLQVLDQTKAKQNQVELLARRRFGGGVAEPYRLKVAQCHV